MGIFVEVVNLHTLKLIWAPFVSVAIYPMYQDLQAIRASKTLKFYLHADVFNTYKYTRWGSCLGMIWNSHDIYLPLKGQLYIWMDNDLKQINPIESYLINLKQGSRSHYGTEAKHRWRHWIITDNCIPNTKYNIR